MAHLAQEDAGQVYGTAAPLFTSQLESPLILMAVTNYRVYKDRDRTAYCTT